MRHRGGGHKRRYRIIDFKRLGDTECIVERLEYDPNRTSWIALLKNIKTSKVLFFFFLLFFSFLFFSFLFFSFTLTNTSRKFLENIKIK